MKCEPSSHITYSGPKLVQGYIGEMGMWETFGGYWLVTSDYHPSTDTIARTVLLISS